MKPLPFAMAALGLAIVLYLGTKAGAAMGWFEVPLLAIPFLVLHVVVTASIFFLLTKATQPAVFVNLYLASIALKMMFFLGVLVAIQFIVPAAFASSALFMVATYVVFTILEVLVLFARVNK